MGRITEKFKSLHTGENALVTYIMGGDPDLAGTEQIILRLASSGADIIELGIPFSDPLADGPVIETAGWRALQNGYRTSQYFDLVKKIRQTCDIPIVFMLYYNLIFKYGIARFAQAAAAAGVDGFIVPDLPPEEAGELVAACRKEALDTIFLIAPTSTRQRLKKIISISTGFIYYVALKGITGASINNHDEVAERVSQIRKQADMPVAVGFGIKTRDDAFRLSKVADGIIVGTSLVKIIEEYGGSTHLLDKVGEYVGSMKSAMTS